MSLGILIGHSFRRSSATFLANSGASVERLMRHGRWTSLKIAERYVDSSLEYKRETGDIFANAIAPKKSRSTATTSSMGTSSRHQGGSSSSTCTIVSSQVYAGNVAVENDAENALPQMSSQGFVEHVGDDDAYLDIEDLPNLPGVTALQDITNAGGTESKLPSDKSGFHFHFNNCDIKIKFKQ